MQVLRMVTRMLRVDFAIFQRRMDLLALIPHFFYTIGGVSVSALLNDYGDKGCADLACDLHDVMKEHTGGDWREFDIVINSDKTVTTQFIYS